MPVSLTDRLCHFRLPGVKSIEITFASFPTCSKGFMSVRLYSKFWFMSVRLYSKFSVYECVIILEILDFSFTSARR
jgi:hypothetical protein